ncbi:hypothetical protein BRARA_J01423 [Brassica rapa]|uniref:Glycosyltransferase family protein 2 n=1 Tax=Brassica campestris TaxID=3711 RepID=A0A397XKI1_BRACM|nr:hypothetical protein BRARA_J01423 [Brassica rapa]
MGFIRPPAVRKDGDYIESIFGDYSAGKTKPSRKINSTKFVTVLTLLQFVFAVYATGLLYYMSPSIDLRAKPDFTWATKWAHNMRSYIVTPHVVSHIQDSASFLKSSEENIPAVFSPAEVCEYEKIDFSQKKSNDEKMIKMKRELYDDVLVFQKKNLGSESLEELMKMKSKWALNGPNKPKVTVILNHFKRKTLCAQLDSLLHQTLPFHHVWVLAFGSPNEPSLRRIAGSYNDSRISFISSNYDFKYYGRFQIALQTEADLKALKMATETNRNGTALVLLPRASISKVLWMADLRSTALPNWNKMRVSVNIITQNRAQSLLRLLRSLSNAYYLGDEIPISFNMDSKVDEETIKVVTTFDWPHGPKTLRRRIIQGGLIRAVSESWYPASDDDFGLLLEDDIEVSPYYYLWIKYSLLAYHYDPQISFPELASISLYTPKIVEVVKERPKWNPTDFFKQIHPHTPYLHQLPCSWGAVFFPKQWREFYVYMNMRFTENAKANPVQIPKSRTNGWQASWKKFLIDMMYLRGYVSLYPNFPNQQSFSTNHMEPGAHIAAKDNVVKHNKTDFEVPLLMDDFRNFLPNQKLPPASKLPSLNLFNMPVSLKGLKAAGAKLGQDVLRCNNVSEIVAVNHQTGLPARCMKF